MTNLLKWFNPNAIIRRYKSKTFNWHDEGIQYPGFKYYPRFPDFQDPPYEPSKLFRVQRIKRLKGTPHYEKEILRQFKLDGKMSDIAIIKNIPENNARLWKIKHLIKMEPITFPNGFPKDTQGTYLKENGELVVKQQLIPSENRLSALEAFDKNPIKLDGDTLRRDTRKRWITQWQ